MKKFVCAHVMSFRCIVRRQMSSNASSNMKMDSEERTTFIKLSDKWYKKEMSALQTLNKLRVPWIVQSTSSYNKLLQKECLPLRNISVLDIGCGGGILSEPLARLGASVTGIDTVQENIDFAKNRLAHCLSKRDAKNIDNRLTFIHTDVESLLSSPERPHYDVVVASEVLEHVEAWPTMIAHINQLLKPNGVFFATTINRTYLSSILAIHLAERFLVPPGTHDWDKFIQPKELSQCLKKNGLHVTMIQGMTLNPLTGNWRWIDSTLVNYAIEAIKVSAKEVD